MKTINYHMLEAKDACEYHLKLFQKTFGDGEVELSEKNLKKAIAVNLDIPFLSNFLTNDKMVEYYDLTDYYWAEYENVRGLAWAEYYKVSGLAQDEYDKVCGPARAEYDKVCGLALAEYYKVSGKALIRILREQA